MKSPVSALCGSITAERHRNPLNYLIVLQPDSVETLSLSGSLSEAVMNFSSFHYGRPRFGRFWNGFEMGMMKSLNAKCDYMQRVALLPPTAGFLCYSATAPVWEWQTPGCHQGLWAYSCLRFLFENWVANFVFIYLPLVISFPQKGKAKRLRPSRPRIKNGRTAESKMWKLLISGFNVQCFVKMSNYKRVCWLNSKQHEKKHTNVH